MDEITPTPELEILICQSFGVPKVRPEFVEQLHRDLMQQTGEKGHQPTVFLGLRRGWAITLVLLFLLITAALIAGPQRVYAAITRFFGYLPGVGIIDQPTPVRMLATPVTLTHDGITLTIQSAYLTEEKTTLTYTVEGVPASARPSNETVTGCTQSASLILLDGQILAPTGGRGTDSRFEEIYAPIPAGMGQARFVLPCVFETIPGKAPEDWELALHFKPAPPDLTLAPVIELTTPTFLPTTGPQTAYLQPTLAASYGIQFVLDKAIPLEDGYYLIGHSTWSNPKIEAVYPDFKAFDTGGQEIPIEQAFFSDAGLDSQPDHWLFKLYGKIFDGKLALQATQVGIQLTQPTTVTIDPQAYGFDGTDSQLDRVAPVYPSISMRVLDIDIRIVQLKYLKQGDEKGFEFGMEASSDLLSLPLNLDSPVTGGRGASGGGAYLDDATGRLYAIVLSDGQMTYPPSFSVTGFRLAGSWKTSWNPPPGAGLASPTPVPQACLNLEDWKKILQQNPTLPPGLEGKALTMRGALAPNPSLFVSNLDGSDSRGLVFGWGSLSPDGDWAAYDDNNSMIWVENLQNGQKEVIIQHGGGPIWSPDGKRIAYVRRVGGETIGIAVINADGSQDRLMIQGDSSAPTELVGWTPDGASIIYQTFTNGNAGTSASVSQVALDGGAISSLLTAQIEAPAPAFSPDGRWLAFIDQVVGYGRGLYIANSDGSQRRLLVQLDYWPVSHPIWSPDGKWLAFTVFDADAMNLIPTDGAINVETCKVIPLTGLSGGEIQTWVKP